MGKKTLLVLLFLLLGACNDEGENAAFRANITAPNNVTFSTPAKIRVSVWKYNPRLADASATLDQQIVLNDVTGLPAGFDLTRRTVSENQGYYLTVLIDVDNSGDQSAGDYRDQDINHVFDDPTKDSITITVTEVSA